VTETVSRPRRWGRPLDLPARVALVLGLVGIAYRLALILLTVPGSNSDEATFGLAAAHIAKGRAFPVFLYGQHYMGVLESYLAAPLFALFEPGWVLLRLPLLGLWAAFVYLIYRLTRAIYSPWLAAVVVGLLTPGSERVIRDQITTVGGRPEIKPAVVGLLLIALALGQRRIRHRPLAFAGFGLIAGICLWVDWLVLPYLVVAVGVLVVGCWREPFGPAVPLVVAGFLLGLAPLILDNLTAPPGQDTLSVLREVGSGQGEERVPTTEERLHGAVLLGLPLASGLCPSDGCARWQLGWGVIYPLLLLVAAALAVAGLIRPRPVGADRGLGAGSGLSRRMPYLVQLALPLAAALTLLAYLRNPLSGNAPLASARYLSVLQISLPAVLWPLWLLARCTRSSRRGARHARVVTAVRVGAGTLAGTLLAALAATMLAMTGLLISHIPDIRAEERRATELARTLERADLRFVYGEYWTCNRLIFISQERVTCAVLGRTLRPGQNRYPPYQRAVDQADRPAFVFAEDSPAAAALRQRLDQDGVAVRVTAVGQWRIFEPEVAFRPWR
jgi:hypothetical protein